MTRQIGHGNARRGCMPGPFSMGAPGVLEQELRSAGFRDVEVRVVPSPAPLASAAECLRFQRELFGALHQMLSGLPVAEREEAWAEVGTAPRQFDGPGGFEGPCELLVGAGTRQQRKEDTTPTRYGSTCDSGRLCAPTPLRLCVTKGTPCND
jgi:hypothetical protein